MNRRRNAGFTLLELVVAITLLGIAVALAATPFRASVTAQSEVSQDREAVRLLAAAHERIVRELRQAVYVNGGDGFMVFPKNYASSGSPTTSRDLCVQRWGPLKAGKLNASGLPEALVTYTQIKFDSASGTISLGTSTLDTSTRVTRRTTVTTECDSATNSLVFQTLATGVSALNFAYGGADATGAGAAKTVAVVQDQYYSTDGLCTPSTTLAYAANCVFGIELQWIDVTLTLVAGSGNLTHTSRINLRQGGWNEALY